MGNRNWVEDVRRGLKLVHEELPVGSEIAVDGPQDPKIQIDRPTGDVQLRHFYSLAWCRQIQNTDATRSAITLPLTVLLDLVFIG